jgi:hypothetical protein
MTEFNKNDYLRLGGASARTLAHDAGQRLASAGQTRASNTQEITTELWNDLIGTWVGNKGWNLIAVPSPGSIPTDKGDFKLLIAPYIETLSFKNPGAPARNRGGSIDQFIPALEYQQMVSDKNSGELLHVENGMFLNLSEIVDNDGKAQPLPEFNVARSGTIPHGDSIMLLGKPPFVVDSRPDFPEASSKPFNLGPPPLGYLDPYIMPFEGLNVLDPNKTLSADLDAQEKDGFEVTKTTTIVLDSDNNGGVLNIPFIKNRADAVRMQAIFWLEKVRNKNSGQEFDQLQYTQIIDIAFHQKFGENVDPDDLIVWPHVTINTLVKQ